MITRLKCLTVWWGRQKSKGLTEKQIQEKSFQKFGSIVEGKKAYAFPPEWTKPDGIKRIRAGEWD